MTSELKSDKHHESPKGSVLTLDDEPLVSEIIERILGIKSYSVTNFTELRLSLQKHNPLAVFVDIHLGQNICGLDAIPLIRSQNPKVPIIVLTGDPSEDSIVRALAAGADDFLRKPIASMELIARFNTRVEDYLEKFSQQIISTGDLELNSNQKILRGPKGQRALSTTEINILTKLMQNPGQIVSKEAIKLSCWGPIHVTDNSVDRKLYELRSALAEVSSTSRIRASYGVGVCLVVNDSNVDSEQNENQKLGTNSRVK